MLRFKYILSAVFCFWLLLVASNCAANTSFCIKKQKNVQKNTSEDSHRLFATKTTNDVEGILEPTINLEESNIPTSYGFKNGKKLFAFVTLIACNNFFNTHYESYTSRTLNTLESCPLFIAHRSLVI